MQFAVINQLTTTIVAIYSTGETPPPAEDVNVTIPETKWAEGSAPEVGWYWDGFFEPASFSPPNPPVEEKRVEGLS
jgi:hypothetical protein